MRFVNSHDRACTLAKQVWFPSFFLVQKAVSVFWLVQSCVSLFQPVWILAIRSLCAGWCWWWNKMPLDRACLTGHSLDYWHLMRLLRSLIHWGKNLTKDNTLIMQLLRDNLTLWTSDMQVCIHCYIDVCFMDSAGLLLVDFLVLKQ